MLWLMERQAETHTTFYKEIILRASYENQCNENDKSIAVRDKFPLTLIIRKTYQLFLLSVICIIYCSQCIIILHTFYGLRKM